MLGRASTHSYVFKPIFYYIIFFVVTNNVIYNVKKNPFLPFETLSRKPYFVIQLYVVSDRFALLVYHCTALLLIHTCFRRSFPSLWMGLGKHTETISEFHTIPTQVWGHSFGENHQLISGGGGGQGQKKLKPFRNRIMKKFKVEVTSLIFIDIPR